MSRISLLLLLAAGLVRFVNLGFLDMQAWDEALYAVRAEAVLKYGLLLDQSDRAIDGLYSALHPPLYVLLTALAYEIFGVSEFAARFFSAVFGALTLFVIHRTGVVLRNERTGLIAALLYGLSPLVLFYTRQGQFDATLAFFLSLSVYLLIRALQQGSIRYGFFAGLAAGGALMTKLFVGFGIPLALCFWILIAKEPRRRRHVAILAMVCAGAILVAAPWHAYMSLIHGGGDPLFFLRASSLVERAFIGIEGNVTALGPLYFVYKFFIALPFGAFWFLYSLPSALKRSEPSWLIVGTWFSVLFVVFSLMRTQLEVYILPMLAPASLLAARSLDRALAEEIKPRLVVALSTGTALAVAWSASHDWRNAVKGTIEALSRFSLPGSLDAELATHLVVGALFIVGVAAVVWNRATPRAIAVVLLPLHLVPMAAIAVFSVVYLDQTRYVDGGADLAQFVRDQSVRHLIVAGYDRNPQLTYYLSGADLDWGSPVTLQRIVPPSDEKKFNEWLAKELSDVVSGTLVVLEKDNFIRFKVISPQLLMPSSFVPVFESRRYSAWVRKPSTH